MAKTSRPLNVLVDDMLLQHSAIQDLIAKGNKVDSMSEHAAAGDEFYPDYDYDLILGPACWRIVPGMEDQMIPMAIKAARKTKYPKVSEEESHGNV